MWDIDEAEVAGPPPEVPKAAPLAAPCKELVPKGPGWHSTCPRCKQRWPPPLPIGGLCSSCDVYVRPGRGCAVQIVDSTWLQFHVVYKLQVTRPDQAVWYVQRRYHDFYTLHRELFPKYGDSLPPFPDRCLFAIFRADAMAERQAGFQRYLDALLHLEQGVLAPAVRAFLEAEELLDVPVRWELSGSEVCVVTLSADMCLAELKARIEERTNVPASEQQLMIAGKEVQLLDGALLGTIAEEAGRTGLGLIRRQRVKRSAGELIPIGPCGEPVMPRCICSDRVQIWFRPPLESLLGRGTYGKVYRAQHPDSGQMYAVAVYHWNWPAVPRALAREAMALLQDACHPCVSEVHFWTDALPEHVSAQVYELYTGGDLHGSIWNAVAALGPNETFVPPPQARLWAAQVLMALEHIHTKANTLHLDVRPGTIVLTEHGLAKLTAFESARLGAWSQAPPWVPGLPPGTRGFAAPELLSSRPPDFAADLYSYGVLLWVIFSGGLHGRETPVLSPLERQWPSGCYAGPLDCCQLVRGLVADPQHSRSRPLPPEVRSLCLRLVRQRPESRWSYKQIRGSQLLAPLGMPEAGAGYGTVAAWCRGMARVAAARSRE